MGNLNSSVVHPREVFKAAIENNSANIILLQSSKRNSDPSNEDITLTRKWWRGKVMDIQFSTILLLPGTNLPVWLKKDNLKMSNYLLWTF